MKRTLKYAIPVAAIIAQGIDEPADAGDFYLQIPGVPGESTSPDYKDAIDVLAWSWGVANQIDIGSVGSGGGAGKATFAPLKVIKSIDSATPALLTNATTGQHFNSMTLTATRLDGKTAVEEPYMRMTLETVLISNVSHGGTAGPDTGVTETVTLEMGKVKTEYRKFDAAKGTWGTWQESCWDLIKNVSC
jgi:type VI secretion system secreted protein Hcp